jgi:transmembrane sensor
MFPKPVKLAPTVRNEAVEWFVEFCEEEVDARRRLEFMAWLRRSPEHVRAYLRICAFWEDAEDLQRQARSGISEIVENARREDNVIPLSEGSVGVGLVDPGAREKASWPRGWLWGAGGLAAGVVGVALVSSWLYLRPPTYITGSGEQRVVTLTDGSTVNLDARTRIRVRYSDTQRDIDLLEGQAFFTVAKQPDRPFIVHSDATEVRAVGTQFDVYRRKNATVVTVVEGRVAVEESAAPTKVSVSSSPESAIVVSAGEQVIASVGAVEKPVPFDAHKAIAWSQGKLVFDSVPLGEVIEDFNRYLPHPLYIDDTQLLQVHISGVFSTTDSQQFVEFLHQRFGTTAREVDGQVVITRTP